MTLMSLMGVVDPDSIQWLAPHMEPLPWQEDIRNYNRVGHMTPDRNRLQKYFADLKRVCELEDTVNEWFDKEVYQQICMNSMKAHIVRHIDDFLVNLSQQFQITYIEVGGIDFSVWKIHLKALPNPSVHD